MKKRAELQYDPAVLEADRAHANEPAFDELVSVVRVLGEPLELLGGDQPFCFGHSRAPHGILASSKPRPCRARSRGNRLTHVVRGAASETRSEPQVRRTRHTFVLSSEP